MKTIDLTFGSFSWTFRHARYLPLFWALFGSVISGAAETRYFVVGYIGDLPSDRLGFYIAPMSDPAQIGMARRCARVFREKGWEEVYRQMSEEDLAFRVFAECDGINGDGINRDYSRPGAPPWNWHVVKVNKLRGLGAILASLDGNPWGMEAGFAGLYNPVSGITQIGFSSYGPIGELPLPFDPAQAYGKKRSWIGDFWDDSYPWIYHERLGWLWIDGFNPDSVWMWSKQRDGWIYSAEGSFPWFWDVRSQSWQYYVGGDGENWFYDSATGRWSREFWNGDD